MRSITALLTLLALLAACGENPLPTGPVSVTGDGYRGVLLPASAWPDYAYEVEGFWTATVADVEGAEAALPAAAKRLVPELTEPLDRYVRQYVGVVLENRRVLYVNLIHEDSLEDSLEDAPGERNAWQRELVVVDDGGDWFVEAFFDPATGEFTSLWVHGEA